MKIVADENIPYVDHFFGHLGVIERYPGRTLERQQLTEADILLVRSVTPVNESLLQGTPVQFVGTCTIGTDHLDTDYLHRQQISFSSAPGCNANSVVEYVFSALAALETRWWQSTVGIIGCGNVGGHLYRALTSLGVACRVYDPLLPAGSLADLCGLDEVLAADIICAHAPLTTTGPHPSYHLLGEHELSCLPHGATLISAGRGAVIDNQALLNLLTQRQDLRVALDVWEPEPGLNPQLLNAVQLGSPHIAGYSLDGKVKGTEMIYRALCKHLDKTPRVAGFADEECDYMLDFSASHETQSAEALLQAILLGAYDIHSDDQRLRNMIAASSSQAERDKGFDALRKHYPERREFRHWQVQLTETQAAMSLTFKTGDAKTQAEKKPLSNLLAAMGFKLTTRAC